MTPIARYYQLLESNGFSPDPNQEQAMLHLQRLYEDLIAHDALTKPQQLLARLGLRSPDRIQGVYLWGSVGVGKTWLMDIFYQALPTSKKMRLHFHQFMQLVHHELQQLQGHRDPLKMVAKDLAAQAEVICLDEFLVNDIGDAMLLANLLKALFAERITLLITANVEPDVLYRNGLQRSRFVPAITLIKNNLETVHLPSTVDYRLCTHLQIGHYFYPLDEANQQRMQQTFKYLAGDKIISNNTVLIEGRTIPTISLANDVVWFDFAVLCNVPRSQLDYLEMAKQFRTVLLSNVPHIAADQDNTARYLINLVDVFYDAHVKLILSAAVPLEDIYPEGRLIFEFRRTRSRLLEMQSSEYNT